VLSLDPFLAMERRPVWPPLVRGPSTRRKGVPSPGASFFEASRPLTDKPPSRLEVVLSDLVAELPAADG
jgi:hypothetical protein